MPVAGATVRTVLGSRGFGPDTTTSSDQGVYRFDSLVAGSRNLSAAAPGYQEWRAGTNVNGINTLNFELRRLPAPETFSGSLGEAPHVIPFALRRSGAIDVTLTWTGSASALAVQLVHVSISEERVLEERRAAHRLQPLAARRRSRVPGANREPRVGDANVLCTAVGEMGLTRARACLVTLCVAAAACGDGESASPSAPTRPPSTSAPLRGTVTSLDTGAPVAGAIVRLTSGPKEGVVMTATAAGEYRFDDVPVDEVGVAAHAEGCLEARATAEVNGAATLNLGLRRIAYAALSGVVRNEQGAPVRATVSIQDGPNRNLRVIANPDGRYRFPLVQLGDTLVRASAVGYQVREARVVVDGTNGLYFTLPLLPTAGLGGVVTDGDSGQPIGAATIRLLDGFNAGRSTTTDSRGAYRFEGLTVGSANLAATAPGYVERRDGVPINGTNSLDLQLRRPPVPVRYAGRAGRACSPLLPHVRALLAPPHGCRGRDADVGGRVRHGASGRSAERVNRRLSGRR